MSIVIAIIKYVYYMLSKVIMHIHHKYHISENV